MRRISLALLLLSGTAHAQIDVYAHIPASQRAAMLESRQQAATGAEISVPEPGEPRGPDLTAYAAPGNGSVHDVMRCQADHIRQAEFLPSCILLLPEDQRELFGDLGSSRLLFLNNIPIGMTAMDERIRYPITYQIMRGTVHSGEPATRRPYRWLRSHRLNSLQYPLTRGFDRATSPRRHP